ncbi:hypothetical protein [Streptomyces atratus]|uniref:hypothetical protein n=1 Tax=Streptomyces atratus TaxID=1893 RepID=UPI0033F29883
MTLIDTRLVQTAVMGGPDSDRPVILPEEPHNLDEFRRQFGTNDFWCGTLLGGCGENLRSKRYETKVCHFAHNRDHSGRRTCGRTSGSVDSADHLFVKSHVTRWLADQGHAVRGELRSFGHCPGDAVEFSLRATRQHLRFELHPEDYRSWREAADSLSAKEQHIEWVFGRDGAPLQDTLARQGYALRARCVTEGNERRVLIGTMTAKEPLVWDSLDDCLMTSSGLLTPALDELRAKGIVREGGSRNAPLPGILSLRGAELVFAVDTEAAPTAQSPFAATGRHLVPGFVKPAGSRIVRAHLSLPEGVPAPVEQYVYRLSGAVRLLVTEPGEGAGSSWAVRADGLVKLNSLEAERTGLWRPSVAVDAPLPKASRAPATRKPSAGEIRRRSEIAAELRTALTEVAARGKTITWSRLAERVGRALIHLPDTRRQALLVEVDKPLSPDRPLLCVLVVTHLGHPLPYLSDILRSLGADVPASETAMKRWRQAEIKKAHGAYGRRTTPISVTPVKPAVKEQPTSSPPPQGDLLTARNKLSEMREKLKQAAATRDRTKGSRAQRLAQAIRQGEAHVQLHQDACGQKNSLRKWLMQGDRVLDELDRLIGRPIGPPASGSGQLADRGPASRSASVPQTTAVERRETGVREQQPAERQRPASVGGNVVARNASSPQSRSGTKESQAPERLSEETVQKLADVAREVLADVARSGGGLLTWGDLRLRMGGALPHLHPDDQGELLVALDWQTPADEPLLSILITSTDASLHWLYRHVRHNLGRDRVPDAELEAHWTTEVLRLRQVWRHRR